MMTSTSPDGRAAELLPLRVLVLEDNPGDVRLCRESLLGTAAAIELEACERQERFQECIARCSYDVILSDFSLPGWSALDALRVIRRSDPDIPFIVITGTLTDEQASALLAEGVTDYVLKDRLSRLPFAVLRAVREARNIRDLRQREAILAVAEEIAHLGSWQLDVSNPENLMADAVQWSDEVFRILGYRVRELVPSVKAFLDRLGREDRERVHSALQHAISAGQPYQLRHRVFRPNGSVRLVDARGQVVRDPRTGRPLRMIGTIEDVTERQHAEAALRESEYRYRAVVETISDGLIVHRDGLIQFANRPAAKLFGRADGAELVRLRFPTDFRDDVERLAFPDDQIVSLSRPEERRPVWAAAGRDHARIWLESSTRQIDWQNQTSLLTVLRDVTEIRTLDEQFRQAQKMEAVGRLAGGIAHDFNNILSVIIGYNDLLQEDPALHEKNRRCAEHIHQAARKAATLVSQMLAFSRKQVLNVQVVDLNWIIGDLAKMLPLLIGEDIEVRVVRSSEPLRVRVDVGQMQQVIMNLAVNARDAMPGGGTLTLETSASNLDQDYVKVHPAVKAGMYAQLAVTDTGTGMSPATMARVFEPFFTTKEQGKGTGLGLATAYGIVRQSDGYIWVYSELNIGTTFKIHLPLADDAIARVARSEEQPADVRGNETVLLVEDDDDLRELMASSLAAQGYTVLDADRGDKAVQIAKEHPAAIDILMTDVVLPGMSGRQVANAVLQVRPSIACLYISGYTDDALTHHGVLEPGVHLLQKPFGMGRLAQKLREVLRDGRNRA